MPRRLVLAAVFAVTFGAGGVALAQDPADQPAQAAAPDGRGDEPGALPTLQSTPLSSTVIVDGHLEEPAWSAAPLAAGFTQWEPLSGSPATEPTEFRVLTDERGLYLGIRLHDVDPGGLLRKLRGRDAGALPARQYWNEDDSVAILLDTFHDHRNDFIVNAFFQYNDTADRVSTNLRVNYIYRPGSDLFVVYNETRDLLGTGIPIQDRQLVVKLTYLWRR